MSRIINPLIKIGFANSGINSGVLDYSIDVDRVCRLSDEDFKDLNLCLDQIKSSINNSGIYY